MLRPESAENAPADRTIRSRRRFAASPEVLWGLFENPDLLSRWWGPSGFSNRIDTFDFRTGGTWNFVMRAPDGSEYPQDKKFYRIVRPEEIVIDHEDPVHGFRLFIGLRKDAEETTQEWTMIFDTADEAAKVRPFVEPANEQNLDRLAELLSQITTESSNVFPLTQELP